MAIDRSATNWNKTRAMMIRSFTFVAPVGAASAAPASYYYPREAETS
jgi:hypothetical protein